MRYWATLVLGCTLVLFVAAPAVLAGPREDCAQRDEQAVAIRACSDLIHIAPRDAWAYANRGEVYRLKGDSDRAIADLDEAIRLDPGRPVYFLWRGLAHYAKGDRVKAVQDYDRALALPANTKQDLDTHVLARVHLDTAMVRLQTDCPALYADKGLDATLQACTELIRRGSKDGAIYEARAVMYLLKGDCERAILDADQALRLGGNEVRGVLYLLKGSHNLTYADLQVELGPDAGPVDDGFDMASSMSCRKVAGVAPDSRALDLAIAQFTENIALQPGSIDWSNHVYRGLAYRLKGELDRAIADYGEVIARHPTGALAAHIGRGLAQSKKGSHSLAIADLNEAIRLKADSVLAYIYRGDVYVAMGDRDKATTDYTKAVSLPVKRKCERAKQAEARQRLAGLQNSVSKAECSFQE